jgi:hypothetical protein
MFWERKRSKMSEYKYEVTVNSTELFDAIQKVGQEQAGKRFCDLFLQLSTGDIGFRDAIAWGMYGIVIKESRDEKAE